MGDGMTEVNHLVDVFLSGDDAQAEQTLPAIAFADGEQIVSAFERRLSGTDCDGRWWIARALATIQQSQSVALLTQLLNDPDSDVRACAAMALGELHPISGAEGADALAAHLADENAHVAEICTVALWRIGAAAVPILVRKLQAGSPLERIRAAKALVPIESHQAIPALVAALDDVNAVVTHYAEEALERMGVGMVYVKP
jgi:HEAT repeat protein